MPTSRRSVLAAAGGFASIDVAAAPAAAAVRTAVTTDETVAELVRRSEASNAALMRGDIPRYRALVSYTDDFTLMSPFGGTPSHGRDLTPERMDAIGRFFRNGSLRQELVQAYGSPDMVVLAVIEHAHVEVGGLPAQDWPLRVTLVYRREGSEWRLAHRHADPLAASISLEQSAALARGERSPPPAR
ncbi:MAG: nuclear transport factor 2 family protein [Chitinophagaceae bacterium]|nr:nuclear transport factor 2 family protein [Rubrivivax sp.]